MVSGAVDFGALEFYGLQPLAGRFFDPKRGEDSSLVDGDADINPAIVINETAMRSLGFSVRPPRQYGQTVTWNRRSWSAQPTSGTVAPSEIIGVSPDLALDFAHGGLPADPLRRPRNVFSSERSLRSSRTPEALKMIDAAWYHRRRPDEHQPGASSVRGCKTLYADVILQGDCDQPRRRTRRWDCCPGTVRAVRSFSRRAHEGNRHPQGFGWEQGRHPAHAPLAVRATDPVGQPVLRGSSPRYLMHRWLQGFASHVGLDPLIFVGVGAAALAIALL